MCIANQKASLRNGTKPLTEALEELEISEVGTQANSTLETPFVKMALGKTLSNGSNKINTPTSPSSINYKLIDENSALIYYDLYNTLKAIVQFKNIIDER